MIRLFYLGVKELVIYNYGAGALDDAKKTILSYIIEVLESGEIKRVLERFHKFVDWISKEEHIDMYGIEL